MTTADGDYRAALHEGFVSECIGTELARALQAGPHGTDDEQRQVLVLLECVEEQTRDELVVELGERLRCSQKVAVVGHGMFCSFPPLLRWTRAAARGPAGG